MSVVYFKFLNFGLKFLRMQIKHTTGFHRVKMLKANALMFHLFLLTELLKLFLLIFKDEELSM